MACSRHFGKIRNPEILDPGFYRDDGNAGREDIATGLFSGKSRMAKTLTPEFSLNTSYFYTNKNSGHGGPRPLIPVRYYFRNTRDVSCHCEDPGLDPGDEAISGR
jgi:hypothetical protein